MTSADEYYEKVVQHAVVVLGLKGGSTPLADLRASFDDLEDALGEMEHAEARQKLVSLSERNNRHKPSSYDELMEKIDRIAAELGAVDWRDNHNAQTVLVNLIGIVEPGISAATPKPSNNYYNHHWAQIKEAYKEEDAK